jgi:hypothetical protein
MESFSFSARFAALPLPNPQNPCFSPLQHRPPASTHQPM